MVVPKIEKLDDLLCSYLGQKTTVLDHETSRLTEIGENYGSQILAVKIHVKNQSNNIDAVAKLPPPGAMFQIMFNTPITFKSEIDFYQKIVPELEVFAHENNLDGYIDYVPKFLGARLSLQPENKEIDDGAVPLMENLKMEGYQMGDRITGFDYKTSKLIVRTIAKYHAIPLALKIKKPEIFDEKIRPLFQPYRVFDFDDAMVHMVIDKNRKVLEDIHSCCQYVERVVDRFKSKISFLKNSPKIIREPFATVIHTDTWVNNFLLKYQNGVPVNCKIVDFQLGEYGCPLRDLVLFIFTSVQIPVIQKHYDDLIELYHKTLTDILEKFGCDPSPFSLEEVHKEIKLAAEDYEFVHCMMFLEPLYAVKEQVIDLDQCKLEDLTAVKVLQPKFKERAEFIVQEFVKRNWI